MVPLKVVVTETVDEVVVVGNVVLAAVVFKSKPISTVMLLVSFIISTSTDIEPLIVVVVEVLSGFSLIGGVGML